MVNIFYFEKEEDESSEKIYLVKNIEWLSAFTWLHEHCESVGAAGFFYNGHACLFEDVNKTESSTKPATENKASKMRKIAQINMPVYVKLSDEGKEMYMRHYGTPEPPAVDDDGFTEFSLWTLIHVFGHLGVNCAPFEDGFLYTTDKCLKQFKCCDN